MTGTSNIKYRKLAESGSSSRFINAYEVVIDGKSTGYVWSIRGFSYKGSQGWNRGIRLRDYHPIEWHFGAAAGIHYRNSIGRQKRSQATEDLLEEFGVKEK